MVFNELSLQPAAPDIPTAKQWMSDLISTMRQAQRCGFKGIRTQSNFHNIILADGYPLPRWRNDNEVSREERTFLRTLATKSPLAVDVANAEIKKNLENDDFEINFQGRKGEGLKTAYLLDTLAISLNADPIWDCSTLQVELTQIDDDKLIEETAEILHASHQNHVIENLDQIKQRLQSDVLSGIQLWNDRERIFPTIEFCDAVFKQLRKLRAGDPRLLVVKAALSHLESAANSWQGGRFSLEDYPVEESGESEVTMQQYERERTFICPDGAERIFERHLKLKNINWRIHFFPENQTKKVLVGYIGKHLPTANYPT